MHMAGSEECFNVPPDDRISEKLLSNFVVSAGVFSDLESVILSGKIKSRLSPLLFKNLVFLLFLKYSFSHFPPSPCVAMKWEESELPIG